MGDYSQELATAGAPVLAMIDAILATQTNKHVVDMLKYIRDPEHLFDDGLDTNLWLRKCGVEASWGRDLFTTKVGISPGRCLRELRLLTAARLLLKTSLEGGQIGALVGFGNFETFIRAFEDWLGCTPQQFQEDHDATFRFTTCTGEEILGWRFLDRLASGRATPAEAAEVFDRLLHRFLESMAEPSPAMEAAMEKRLAEDLWVTRLAPKPRPLALAHCRRLFNTQALEDLLVRKGFKPDGGC